MKDLLKDKTILVTGGTGSIGSQIVRTLMKYPIKNVIIFSRDEIKHFLIQNQINDERLIAIIGDIRNTNSIERVFYDYSIDIIYHAAAIKHVVVAEQFPFECAATNISGTQNVVDLALKYKIPRMITISTDKSTSPTNVMGASKLIAEKITTNANYTCVRFGNVANSRGSVIPVLLDNILNNRNIIVTDPDVTRFIIRIPDAINLVLKATKHARGGEIFILKMKAFRLGDLIDVLLNEVVPTLNISSSCMKINYIGLTAGEKMHEDLISPTEKCHLYEIDNLYAVLKNEPVKLDQPLFKKIELLTYSSDSVQLISKEEIKNLILEYLNLLKSV